MSIIFSFWGIGNDTQDRDYFSSDTLFSCYIAILIGALTLYFTIFAFIKPKRMAFANYEKYVLNSTSKILYTTIGISVFINTVSLFFNYKNFFFRLALFESIVYIIVSLIFSIFELNTLENEEKASEIFVKFICSKIQQEKKYKIKKNSNNKKQADISPNVRQYALNLFKNYIVPCFGKTSFIIAFNNTDGIIKKILPELSAEEYKQYLYDFSSNTIDIYSWYADTYLKTQIKNNIKISLIKNEMDEIIKINLVRILKNHDLNSHKDLEKTITTVSSLYEIWFKLYKMLFEYDGDLKYSDILKGIEPLSFGIMIYNQTGKELTDNYIELYRNYIYNAYQLVIFVLHNYNYLTFRNFLQDYIYTIQFIKHNLELRSIIEFQNYYLIVIGTYIANLIQEERIDIKYKIFLTRLIKEVDYIKITYDSFVYTEPLSLTGIHPVKKDFRYYFLLMLIYAVSSEKEDQKNTSLKEIIRKIDLANNEKHVYESLLNTLYEISDTTDIIEKQCRELILQNFSNKVGDIKKIEFYELKKIVTRELDNKLSKYITNDINLFYSYFRFCNIISKDIIEQNLLPIIVPKGFSFCHSGSYIVGKTSFDIFGVMDQFSIVNSFIYHAYIVQSEKKYIKSLDELLEDIKELDTITLLIPIELHSYFYTLRNIKYEGKSIIYNKHKITLQSDRNLKDFILVQEQLKKSVYVKKLEIDARTRILIEDREHGSIDVKIPIEPEFYLDVNSTMTVYSLIGISDDPDLNNR